MNPLAEPLGSRHRLALLAGAIALVSFALLSIAARAHATETIYWDNYSSNASIGFANIDGSGGGALNLSGSTIDDPEGLAYDPANGRIYIASSASDQILWAATDGSGGGVLDTTGAKVESPHGIAVDPATQTVYWANEETEGSIGYASANGGSGGILNAEGASVKDPYKVALDTVNGRIYWAGKEAIVSYANLNGSGGADLPLAEAERPGGWSAINVDPAAGRLYLLGESPAGNEGVYWINLSGVGGGEIVLEGESFDDAYGMAFEPSTGRFYWGNYGKGENRTNAIGSTTLSTGVEGGITIATAPLSGPQDPVIVQSPTGSGAPVISQNVAALSCSQGAWSQDYPGSYVYGAPISYGYQWSLNGAPVAGATAPTIGATEAGSYTCAVTGTNLSGSATQSSGAATVTAASLTAKLQTKKPHAKAGKAAVVKIRLANGGDLSSAAVKVCAAKLSKGAKKGLKAPKCASVKALAYGGSAVATLRVKTKMTAHGVYKFKTQVKGAKVKALTVKVKVTAAKKKKAKKHSTK